MATLDWPKQNLIFSLNSNWNWTRLDMYVSAAIIFVVSHVVSVTLGVLRWYTEQNTQSASYGADLLLSHCRKSESERSQSLDSSIHLNVNAKLSALQRLTTYGGFDDPLNHGFHCAASAVQDLKTPLTQLPCMASLDSSPSGWNVKCMLWLRPSPQVYVL